MNPTFNFGGMMTSVAVDLNDTILTAVEQKNRTEIGVYRGQQLVATLPGGPDPGRVPPMFAGYPAIAARGTEWAVAYQCGRFLRVLDSAGRVQDFPNATGVPAYPIAHPAALRWIPTRNGYVLPFTSAGQMYELALNSSLEVINRIGPTPWGASRFAKVIYYDGRVEWDDQVKAVGGVHKARCYPCPDGRVVCVEWDDTASHVYLDGTYVLAVPPGKRPLAERTSTGGLVVGLTQGRVVHVTSAPFNVPATAPGEVTDRHLDELSDLLEAIYRDTLKRSPEITYVDRLGASRWRMDFLTAAQRGENQAQRLETVRRAIYAAAGIPE
jgi:hypothetical protein